MNLKTRYNLWQEKRKLDSKAKFKVVLWKKLSAAWVAEYNTNYNWYQTPVFKWVTVTVLVIAAAASFNTGVYAYSSPEVIEDTILYPIKKGLEKLEEITKITPENKAQFLLKKIQRREAEKVIKERRKQKTERVDEQIRNIEEKLGETEKLLEKIETKDKNLKPRIRERLEKKIEQRRENLEKREEKLQNVKERLNKLNDKIKNPVLAPGNRRGEGRNRIIPKENKNT